MPLAVFVLATINFVVGTQGFVFAGLLNELATDLRVTVGNAGMLVAATSITLALAAPFSVKLVARIERRRVILVALIALAVINLLCAFAPNFISLTLLRVLAGLATAFVGALASVAAAALVTPEKRGRAFAIVLGGLTIAFVFGVPLGSVIGGAFGWRSTFVFAAILSVLSAALIRTFVPKIAPAPGPAPTFGVVFRDPTMVKILALTLLAFCATFTVVAFIGPVITMSTGISGAGIGALQAVVGVGSIIGLIAGGTLADRGHRRTATSGAFLTMSASLVGYWVLLSAPAGSRSAIEIALLILLGATALFMLIPMNLQHLSSIAGAATPIVLAINGSLVSLGQGLGALWGGWLTDVLGAASMGLGGAAVAILGWLVSLNLGQKSRLPLAEAGK